MHNFQSHLLQLRKQYLNILNDQLVDPTIPLNVLKLSIRSQQHLHLYFLTSIRHF